MTDAPGPTGRELADWFERDEDLQGAHEWRIDQALGLLQELQEVLHQRDVRQQRRPITPTRCDLDDLVHVVTRLGDAAGRLGIFNSKDELEEVLGVELPPPVQGPACGHSACRQHWIDTGSIACIAGESG